MSVKENAGSQRERVIKLWTIRTAYILEMFMDTTTGMMVLYFQCMESVKL